MSKRKSPKPELKIKRRHLPLCVIAARLRLAIQDLGLAIEDLEQELFELAGGRPDRQERALDRSGVAAGVRPPARGNAA